MSKTFSKITEQDSNYRHLEKMSTSELLKSINTEDQSVALAVEKQIPSIKKLVDIIVEHLKIGGRLFYIGAGTSGRLGILDASECPPTFGVSPDMVNGIIAGGDQAIRKAVEHAEDDTEHAWKDLQTHNINSADVVIGIAASGSTPYVVGGLKRCQSENIVTGCIVCNPTTDISKVSDYPIEVIVGPEFLTGSSRMKAGTAQKLVLNMISTSVMVKLGRVKDNKMVDMQLSNDKLKQRGSSLIAKALGIPEQKAIELLNHHGSVRKAIEHETHQ
ncbi:N-acetylmuramic acid-6-phosphate etherase [Psychroflexus gondwanensis ACAM 44]|jgi:N-acetylmuramic acid 6-phosphate etherase|uniref:N-acetylmuramic acid 6-phosphate etherase n=1 Tax=Psychroflexus gondwanensis ACAM 44 TaxID=1189619 RepID=N1X245_9FLAO|nr:N-acetylmuramic acid 6-phosphate etherase [Psychroflexus gondwanensis]EMY82133.1 N-acetylmuramic acid-6-phosphate etherase [Psychroflexus gondwanensis ACAM 44]